LGEGRRKGIWDKREERSETQEWEKYNQGSGIGGRRGGSRENLKSQWKLIFVSEVTLKDLLYQIEGSPDYLNRELGIINMTKVESVGKILDENISTLKVHYNLAFEPKIQQILSHIPDITSDNLSIASQHAEPSAGSVASSDPSAAPVVIGEDSEADTPSYMSPPSFPKNSPRLIRTRAETSLPKLQVIETMETESEPSEGQTEDSGKSPSPKIAVRGKPRFSISIPVSDNKDVKISHDDHEMDDTLNCLLHKSTFRKKKFARFLESEYSGEVLVFWELVTEFNREPSWDMAFAIVQEYINPGADHQIIMPTPMQQGIIRAVARHGFPTSRLISKKKLRFLEFFEFFFTSGFFLIPP
jgi:hypothetical protein